MELPDKNSFIKMKSVIVFCLCVASVLAVPSLERKAGPIRKHPGGRIVGGDVAEDKQFPFQVAVYYDNPDGSFFGGGSLIQPNWVLTAGHVVYRATVFTLHLGSNSLVLDDPNRVTLGASHSEVHPDYDPDTLNNDIGLIRIDSVIELNDYISLIPLTSFDVGSGLTVTVSGWGASGDWDGATPDLNYVDLQTITNARCKEIYGEATITDGMLCAVGPTIEGTCSGDSGGPLVTDDGSGKTLVAIASWASASGCQTDHPSGYTRVKPYETWIESVIA